MAHAFRGLGCSHASPVAAVFLLLLLPFSCAGSGVQATPGSVTTSLEEYQELYDRATRADVERKLEAQRNQFESELERVQRQCQATLQEATDRRTRQQVFPGNYQLLSHEATGAVIASARSLASYNFTLLFRVFDSQWTSIPLIDAQTIVADLKVYKAEESGTSSNWTLQKPGQAVLTTLKEREVVTDDEAWQDHMLVVNSAGLFKVNIQAVVQVQSNRNLHGLALNLLHPLTSTRLRLPLDPQSSIKEVNTEPAAFIRKSESAEIVDIQAAIPSSKTISIKWRVQSGIGNAAAGTAQPKVDAEQEVDTPTQAAVVHDSIHSVEDGILESTHVFKYMLDVAQSLSNVQVNFLGGARVTSVAAHGMQTWHAVPMATNSSEESGTAVHVAFKSSVISREIIIMVTTEIEFDASTGRLPLPVAVCQGVLRQPGTLAVVKVANVEIHEDKAVGATRAGVEDVPEHLRARVGWPIVLAYKFPAPRHNISVSVVKHEELSTLEAVVDTALYKALVLDSQIMHSFLLVLQNTRQQYMQIFGIPAEASLWSLKVNSVATKPVRTSEGRLLVPLLVGTTSSASATKTSVELTWLTSQALLGSNGTLPLHPPAVDMPVAALSAEVFFPETYAVKVMSSLREVDRFSQKQPSPVSYQTGEDVVPASYDFESAPPPRSNTNGAGVKTKLPKAGTRYLLEQLLVLPDPGAQLSVSYERKSTTAASDIGVGRRVLERVFPSLR